MQDLEGAFSCICLVKGVGLIAFRDPNGIRPLVLGTRLTPDGPEWCIASEDCAFGPIGFKRVRDVQPGEMIIVTEDGDLVCSQCTKQQLRPCIFEYIYLARPDSVLNDISVYGPPASPGMSLQAATRGCGLCAVVRGAACTRAVPAGCAAWSAGTACCRNTRRSQRGEAPCWADRRIQSLSVHRGRDRSKQLGHGRARRAVARRA